MFAVKAVTYGMCRSWAFESAAAGQVKACTTQLFSRAFCLPDSSGQMMPRKVTNLTFDSFVQTHMPTFEKYSEGAKKRGLTDEQMKRTYRLLCRSAYNSYLRDAQRSNPSLAV